MRKLSFSIWVAFWIVVLWVPLGLAADGKEVVEQLGQGLINWTQGVITAKGSGAPPAGIKNVAQARLMAERAAKADALRNLLETVKGVRVDSETTVESFTTKSDRVLTRVSGIVKGARLIGTRYLSDGAVEVTMAVDLTGELLAVMLQELPPLALPPMPTPAAPRPPPIQPRKEIPPQPKPQLPSSPPVEEKKPTPSLAVEAKGEEKLDLKKLEYTGLIVDARKLGLRPALVPRILNEKGELVYSTHSVAQQELIKMGLVGYAKDVNAAAKNHRVTADPYVVSGLNATGEKKTDVVISNRDAQVILTTAPYTGYLKNGRVMVVYD